MIRKLLLFPAFLLLSNLFFAQKGVVSGYVKNELNLGLPFVKIQCVLISFLIASIKFVSKIH